MAQKNLHSQKKLSLLTAAPFIETDAMYWKPDWTLVSDDEVIKNLPLTEASWIIDGNFVSCREKVWRYADHIIWLNFPPRLVMERIIKRNLSWVFAKPSAWTGNRMPIKVAFSGIFHTLGQVLRHRKTFPHFLSEFKDENIYIFKTPAECQSWIEWLLRSH